MNHWRDGYKLADEMLNSPDRSLKVLAQISHRSEFSFYRGANLTNVDLTGQDLTGLNFDFADIRFSILNDVKFDAGAFNLSIVDDSQEVLRDEFLYHVEELQNFPHDNILIFCKIRPGMLDKIIREFGLTYREFSDGAGVSEGALRKSRNGGVIAWETAVAVLEEYQRLADDPRENESSRFGLAIRQPCIEFLSGGISGQFRHISRNRLHDIMLLKGMMDEFRRANGQPEFKDTPEFIETMFEYYLRSELEDLSYKLREIKISRRIPPNY